MPHTIEGTFDVKILPQVAEAAAAGQVIARMLLDKRFHGALDATSTGQMLAMRSKIGGSAGYVAMELVQGTLAGRVGSFVLQHSGSMNRGAATLSLTVVADSGTDALEGLDGSMQIIISEGTHSYKFDYALPDLG